MKTNQSPPVLQSPIEWQTLASLQPRLRSHISLHPQVYRGQRWYVLHDSLTGRHTRLNSSAYNFVRKLNGHYTIDQISKALIDPTQTDGSIHQPAAGSMSRSEIGRLLYQLQYMGALVDGIERNADDLSAEHERLQTGKRKRRWMTPLAIRIPLFDPDELLNRLTPRLTPFLGRSVVLLWAMFMFLSMVIAIAHSDELINEFIAVAQSPANLLLFWFVYPFLKTIHEFSHAICLKRRGGEVHEMGITLLLFTPVPYVDASAAWVLPSRYQRALVSAAGIVAEVTMAALALFIWVSVEPGIVRDIAFAVLMVGSLSTLVFNANPLLKFDGYYVLQDLIEIPNLYNRAQRYYVYLAKRYLLSITDTVSPVSAIGERVWFVVYGALAFIYRSVILLSIALWLIGKFMVVGVLITVWVLLQQFVFPIFSAISFLVNAEELEKRRVPAAALVSTIMVVIVLFLVLVPVPRSTRTEGIVWVPDQAQLYASSEGRVAKVFVQPGTSVVAGDPVVRLEQPFVDARVLILNAKLKGLQLREAAERVSGSAQSQITVEEIALVVNELSEFRRQQQELVVSARSSGIFTVNGLTGLLGRHFAQGDLIGHVVNPSQLVVKAVVPESRIGPVRDGITAASIRLAERFERQIPVELSWETPSANNQLPGAALGTAGGGGIAVAGSDTGANNRTGENADAKTLETVNRVFHFELRLPPNVQASGVGERAYVRFQHPAEPLAHRWLDSTRQLFLSRLPGFAT